MNIAGDLLLVGRRLWSSPGYTSAVIFLLALVLGANASMFAAVNATLLRPIAASNVDRLVVSWASDPLKNAPVVELSYRNFQDWVGASRSLEQAAAFGLSAWPVVLRGRDGSERLPSAAVSATFFDTYGTSPLMGRGFRAADDAPNAERVVMLSHRLWVSRFGANPNIVGTTIQLDKPHIVVGVMPAGFDFPFGVDLWTPVMPILSDSSAQWNIDALTEVGALYVLGRLRDGVSAEAAASELNATAPLVNSWYRQVMARIASLPGIDDVGAIFEPPLRLGPIGADSWIVLEGQTDSPRVRARNPAVNYQVASPGYFSTMRIALKRGRAFTDRDDAQAVRVALVSESTARRLWSGQEPIGRRILMPSQSPVEPDAVWRTVFGVVADVRYRGVDDVRHDVYDAALQSPLAAANLVIRVAADPASATAAVRAAIREVDPDAVIDRVGTMEAAVARATAPWRFGVWVFASFAFVACALAAAGLFGLVALDVIERQRELALRVAVGARRADVLRLTLARVGGYALIGVSCGLVAAVAITRVIQGMLFQVAAVDLRTYLAVIVLIVSIVAIASYLPARRAAAADPLALLKGE